MSMLRYRLHIGHVDAILQICEMAGKNALIVSSCGENQIDRAEWCKENHELRIITPHLQVVSNSTIFYHLGPVSTIPTHIHFGVSFVEKIPESIGISCLGIADFGRFQLCRNLRCSNSEIL